MILIAKPQIDEAEIKAVSDVLRSGMIAQGQRVADFEEAFAEFCDVEHAVALNSGTAALHAALLAYDIGPGDEVITSPFSFVATANSVLFTGARPVFADIRPDTFNIDPELVAEKITPRTKAIMPVHLYGQSADMDALTDLADDHDLLLIEDACQAHGATYKGKKVGSFGTGAFSFYPTKNMTTSEGGMLTTHSKDIADKVKMIRAHGSVQRYLHEMLGYNLRMTDICAAIGLVQLQKLEAYTKKRQANAEKLSHGLKGAKKIVCPTVKKECEHVFHQYTIRTTARDELAAHLNSNGIGTGVHYPLPIHMQPYYKGLGYKDSMPHSEKASREVLSLPVHPQLSNEDLDHIIKTIKAWSDKQ